MMIPPNERPESRRLFGEGLGRGAPASPATDKSEKVQFSVAQHGRRSMRNLRRPPQEVAASCLYVGGRKHGRSGATAGEPRPSATNPAPFPSGEGVAAKAVTDRENLACSASRRARMRAVTPASPARLLRAVPSTLFQSPRMRVQRAEGPLARVWGEEPQRSPIFTRAQHDRRKPTQSRAGCGHCPPRSPSVPPLPSRAFTLTEGA